jgi:MFS family permease
VTRDRRLLYAAAFLRALATGMVGVLLGLHLAGLRFPPARVGAVVAVGLAGGALAALLTTLRADRHGRRRTLLELTLLGAAGGAVLAVSSSLAVVAAAAFVGMVNGMGRDRGAALVLEQAILPATTGHEGRTRTFAWYNLLQDAGHALGALLAGLPETLSRVGGIPEETALRAALGLYSLLTLLGTPLYVRLSPAVERTVAAAAPRLSPPSRRILWQVSALFALDSLGGGFLTTALLTLFFHERFGAGAGALGLLFFAARVANALSHLAAAWLARRFGLLNTMVFTHVPSSLLLVTVPFAPTFGVAAFLFLLREGLVEMDVPTRQSYVMAVVRPDERTLAAGVTHLVRLGGWAVAPALAGLVMQRLAPGTPFIVGAAMKLVYDVLLYTAFRHVKPPEERRAANQ